MNSKDQHQPLRIPQNWDQQERMLIVQLEHLLNEIYRKLGDLDRRVKALEE